MLALKASVKTEISQIIENCLRPILLHLRLGLSIQEFIASSSLQ